jgi:hypothetical protein
MVMSALLLGTAVCSNGQTVPTSEGWSKTADLQPQPKRVSSLTPQQIDRVRKLQKALAEVDPSSFDKWVEDFEKDKHPESEIQIWESIASAYTSYSSTHPLPLEGKQDVLGILLLRSGTADEQAILSHIKLKVLTANQALDVMAQYKGIVQPVVLEKK